MIKVPAANYVSEVYIGIRMRHALQQHRQEHGVGRGGRGTTAHPSARSAASTRRAGAGTRASRRRHFQMTILRSLPRHGREETGFGEREAQQCTVRFQGMARARRRLPLMPEGIGMNIFSILGSRIDTTSSVALINVHFTYSCTPSFQAATAAS